MSDGISSRIRLPCLLVQFWLLKTRFSLGTNPDFFGMGEECMGQQSLSFIEENAVCFLSPNEDHHSFYAHSSCGPCTPRQDLCLVKSCQD